MSRTRVVIIGGGLAGLSAAESLLKATGDRVDVTLLEAKRSVGGRAGSFVDPGSGQSIDYCQHVAMGCCTNLLALLQRCQLADALVRYDQLQFLHPQHPPSRFAASRWLAPPAHLSSALSGLTYLTPTQRHQIRLAMLKLFRTSPDDVQGQTAIEWLQRHGQNADTLRDFWEVIVVSALAEKVERVSMAAVRKVIVDGFAAARGAFDVLVPRMPLAELFGRRLRDAVASSGARILEGQVAKAVCPDPNGVTVACSGGAEFLADHVIVAVPWHAVGRLLDDQRLPELSRCSRFPSSPITGLHLWFDRQLTTLPHCVFVGTLAQWMFRQPWGHEPDSEHRHYYQVVISASRDVRSMSREALVDAVREELIQMLPDARGAKLLASRMVTDPHSVFSLSPEVDGQRPPSRTALPWLHLAGDWIATGWPSTMEGAVISGRMAANSVLERIGSAPAEIDPGLPRGWLARALIRS